MLQWPLALLVIIQIQGKEHQNKSQPEIYAWLQRENKLGEDRVDHHSAGDDEKTQNVTAMFHYDRHDQANHCLKIKKTIKNFFFIMPYIILLTSIVFLYRLYQCTVFFFIMQELGKVTSRKFLSHISVRVKVNYIEDIQDEKVMGKLCQAYLGDDNNESPSWIAIEKPHVTGAPCWIVKRHKVKRNTIQIQVQILKMQWGLKEKSKVNMVNIV